MRHDVLSLFDLKVSCLDIATNSIRVTIIIQTHDDCEITGVRCNHELWINPPESANAITPAVMAVLALLSDSEFSSSICGAAIGDVFGKRQ